MKKFVYNGITYTSEWALRRAMPHAVFPSLSKEVCTSLGVTVVEEPYVPPEPTEEDVLLAELRETERKVELLRKRYVQAKMLDNANEAELAKQEMNKLFEGDEDADE